MSPISRDRLIDDADIIGGSPTDRIIGMLLERVEAIRELHDSMREENRELIDTHAEIKNMMVRVSEKLDNHERSDLASFAAVNSTGASINAKLDGLISQINVATTDAIIQKAQFNAGWKVIVIIGGIAMAIFGIFAIFFNHTWK